MGVSVETVRGEEDAKQDHGRLVSENDLPGDIGDQDSYSDSNDKIFASVIEIQGDILTNTSEDYRMMIANYQRQLAATVSGAERSEAIRQAKELELTRVCLLNKKLLETCENQRKEISHLEEKLQVANEQHSEIVADLNSKIETEKNRSEEQEKILTGQLKDRLEQTNILRDCLNETQSRLTIVETERDELHLEVDRLNRDLARATEERMKTELLMESEASDLNKLQLDHKNLLRDHEHLCERYARIEQRLVTLRSGLPTIVRQAVTNAVHTVQTVATAQLEQANSRLAETEERLDEQLERLRQLEFADVGHEQRVLHFGKLNQSPPVQHTTETTVIKPKLKPRSKNKAHDRTADADEITQSEATQSSVKQPNQSFDQFSKPYYQSALMELDQRRLYRKICDAIQILEGENYLTKTRESVRNRPRQSGKSPASRVHCTSKDNSDATKCNVRVPAPPWRAPSHRPSGSRPVTAVQTIRSKGGTVQRGGTSSDQTTSDNELTANSVHDLQLKIWDAVNQLTDMLRVRKALREAPKTNLLDRIKSLEKQNQALQKMVQCVPHAETIQKPLASSTFMRCASTVQQSKLVQPNSCVNPQAHDSGFHRTVSERTCCSSATCLVDLQAHCLRAASEASRWKRRWQVQEAELQAQRERISVMKINQQADLQIREHFLQSVCKLVREASHQIDRIVRKAQACGLSHFHQPCPGPLGKIPSDTQAIGTQQPSPRLKRVCHTSLSGIQDASRSDHPLSVEGNRSRSGLTTAHGDESEQNAAHRINRSVAVGPTSHSSTEEIMDLPDTNCNNNEVSVPHSDLKSTLCLDPDIAGPVDRNQKEASAAVKTVDSVRPNIPDGRVAHRDLYLTGSPLSKTASIISDIPSASIVSEWQYGSEKELSAADDDDGPIGQVSAMDAAQASPSMEASPQQITKEREDMEANLARWNAMRDVARYELSRVLSNVVAQAKQDNSVAQECLKAIAELQTHLELEIAASQKPQNPNADAQDVQPVAQPLTLSLMPAGEGKDKVHSASRQRLSATQQLLRRNSSCRSRGSESQPVHERLYHASKHSNILPQNSNLDHETMSNTSFNRDSRSDVQPVTLSNSNLKRSTDKADDKLSLKRLDRSRERPLWRPSGTCCYPLVGPSTQPLSIPRSRTLTRVSKYLGPLRKRKNNNYLSTDILPDHVDIGEGLLNSPQVTSNSESSSKILNDHVLRGLEKKRAQSLDRSPVLDITGHNTGMYCVNPADEDDDGFYSDGYLPSYPADTTNFLPVSSHNGRHRKICPYSMQPGQFLENVDRRLAEQSVCGDRSNHNRGMNFRTICRPLSKSKLLRTARGTANVPVDNELSSLSPLPFDSGTGSVALLTNAADHSTFLVTVDPESDLSRSLYESGSITKTDHSNTHLCKMNNMNSYNPDDKESSECNQSCSVILNIVEPSADMSTVNRFPNMSCGSCCCGTGCCVIYLDNPD